MVPAQGAIAALDLLALMVLTCVDVLGRYFFNRPVYGGFELTEMMLAALIFAALPLVSLRNQHVTVDLFEALTPAGLLRIQHVTACLVGVLCTGYLAWRLWLRAGTMMAAGETTAQLKLEISWLTYGMSVLMALTAVALAVLATRPAPRHSPDDAAL